VLLFLALPLRFAERISPAFRGWTLRDRTLSIGAFVLAVLPQIWCWNSLGPAAWLRLCGAPLLVFSWFYSAQLYIYHYATSIGPNVTQHARALGGPWVNWWLLNLNEHDTHHLRPAIVWYRLRDAAHQAQRQSPGRIRRSLVWGICNQLRGPRIVTETEQA
jgi:fatty acid desaturase